MADFHGVLTSMKKTTNITTNKFGPPKSGQPVYLTESGFIANRSAPILWAVTHNNPVTVADIRATATDAYNGGAYFDATITLDPAVLYPDRRLTLITTTAARVWTLPTAANFIQDLKDYYGYENITAGLWYEMTLANASLTAANTLTINGVASFTVNNGTNYVLTPTATNWISVRVIVWISNVTPLAEAVSMFIF